MARVVKSEVDGKYECSRCPFRRRFFSSVRMHVEEVHLKLRKHRCWECGASFTWPSKLEAHKRRHTTLLPFACNFCSHAFRTAQDLADHLYVTHPSEGDETKKWVSCPRAACERKFRTEAELNRHLKVHDEPSTLDCEMCGRVFKSRGALKLHVASKKGCVRFLEKQARLKASLAAPPSKASEEEVVGLKQFADQVSWLDALPKSTKNRKRKKIRISSIHDPQGAKNTEKKETEVVQEIPGAKKTDAATAVV